MTDPWVAALRGDPRPWLLDSGRPAVRQLALRWLEDWPADDPGVRAAQAAAASLPPVAPILDGQDPAGWWVKPGPGYGPKYTGTVWSLIILEQLGADPADPRIAAGCEYVLAHTQTGSGGFGCSGSHLADRPPPPSSVLHCLNGNLLRSLIAFGHLGDARVASAVDWQARSVLGGPGAPSYHASGTSGPGFACGVNEGLPCAWGAVKALRGLAAIPPDRRTPAVKAAIDAGLALLLAVDPATAGYPAGWGGVISRAWFKLGFPSGYVADVLQVGEVLAELGRAKDHRLSGLVDRVLAKQDEAGRWRNEYPYRGKLWSDVDAPREPSPWVTLRACRFLRAALG
ncbi:MAG: nitrogen fixation protein NifH [Chloroflexi bacterium]|nr:nitrogen fixation protein NifH [Chloroflexota bacterium]